MARSLSLEQTATTRRKSWRRRWAEYKWGYLFVLPSMVMFAIFVFWPVVWSLFLSFHDASLTGRTWNGLENFRTLAGDRIFRKALGNTAIYSFVTVPIHLLVSLGLAAMIKPLAVRWQTFFRAAYYLPAVTSAVLIATVWRWMFNAQYGMINQIFALGPVPWLNRPNLALWAVIISGVLTIPASGVVMYSAAMGAIPDEYYEAASLEGAGPFDQWWHITIPLLKPTSLYLVVMYTIWAFEIFERVFIMTGGGPAYATTTIVQLIYDTGFQNWRYGLASAQAFILFLIIAVVSVVQFRYFRSDVEY